MTIAEPFDLRGRLAVIATFGACALVLIGCILLSMALAERRSRSIAGDEAMQLVAEVLRKVEATNGDIDSIVNQVSRYPDAQGVCGTASIALMQQVAAASILAQAAGRVRDGRLLCSSLGDYGDGLLLPPVIATSATDRMRLRMNVTLPGLAGHKYLVTERDGVAVFVDQSISQDLARNAPDVPLGLFYRAANARIIGRGEFRPQWMQALGSEREARVFDGDYLVAMRRLRNEDAAVFVAYPLARVQTHTADLRTFMLPMGVLIGLICAWGIYRLARLFEQRATGFRYALQSTQVFMQYQPIVDLRTGRCIGAEALMRWKSGQRMVPPDRFIPAAEKAGFIERVTERVVELVAHDATGFLRQHPDFHISINLSAADLNSDRTVSMLMDMLDRTGLPAQNFWVEATERGFMEGAMVARVINEIRTIGMRVAIDDFGTGYSSLAFLSSFQLDVLKIDKRFVDAIGTDGTGAQVVTMVIELAKSLGLEVVAEGVETVAQARFLRDRGVQYAQGWLFGRPKSVAALGELLSLTPQQTDFDWLQSRPAGI